MVFDLNETMAFALAHASIDPKNNMVVSNSQVEGKSTPVKVFEERDNKGTRHDSFDQAMAYWMVERRASGRMDPFVLATFDSQRNAIQALLDIPCIKATNLEAKPICLEPLIFGCYLVEDGLFEAVLCGAALSASRWEQARRSFLKHHGKIKNQQEPEADESKTSITTISLLPSSIQSLPIGNDESESKHAANEPAVTSPEEIPLAPEVIQLIRDLKSSSPDAQSTALSEIRKRFLCHDDRVMIAVAEALGDLTWQNQTGAINFVLPNDPKLLGYLERVAKRYADKPNHVVYMDANRKIKAIKAK